MTLNLAESVPAPFTLVLDVDLASLFRIQVEATYHIAGLFRPGVGTGFAFELCGKQAPTKGGFQFKLPILFEAALGIGDADIGDGWSYHYRRVLIGPSTGVDFVWWKKERRGGFYVSLDFGYMFHFALPADGAKDDEAAEDTLGIIESSILFGVAL